MESRTPLTRAALMAVPLFTALGLVSASCTHTDDAQAASGDEARTRVTGERAVALHPPLQKDAADGQVFDYY